MSKYQICTRCIMDTSDPKIYFDDNGVCNHCHRFDANEELYGYREGSSDEKLKRLVAQMKKDGQGKEYDCILGISGGVDSAYMAYLTKKLNLRVLAVHVDAGWNSDVAVKNIKKMCEKLKIDLHTVVIDWPTMKELQRAYMFSGLANLDVPQDHVFLAAMYNYASKCHVKYMLNGSNVATEGVSPVAWGYTATDYANIKSVYKKYGRGKSLKKYPHFGVLKYLKYQSEIVRVDLLNYVPYSKKEAMETLEREFGWEYYGGKHYESRFTKFFQGYFLPQRFGYDKKRSHLSSLVLGGEMTREEALEAMKDDSDYTEAQMMEDKEYILKKLDISDSEWEGIMKGVKKTEDKYHSRKKMLAFLRMVKRKIKVLKG